MRRELQRIGWHLREQKREEGTIILLWGQQGPEEMLNYVALELGGEDRRCKIL